MDASDVDIVGSPERNIYGSIVGQEDGESLDELEVGDRNTHVFHSILQWLLLYL